MPCMSKGRVVPGAKGSCPDGSTWSETSGDGKFQMADVGDKVMKRYFDKEGGFNAGTAAMDALVFVPGFGWVARGAIAGAKTAGSVGAKGLGNLINKMFMKKTDAIPAQSGLKAGQKFGPQGTKTTIPSGTPAVPAGMKFAPGKSSVMAGTGLAINEQFGSPLTQAGQEAKAQRQIASAASQVPTATPVDANATKALETQKESERVAGLGFFDKMKEPGYWDTSITGVEGDDRLSRIGDLLTYYGMPPSGRAAAGQTPSEMWKQRSIDAAAAVAGASGVDSPYSKIGNKTGIEAITEKVKKDFGNTWLPFDVALGARLNDDEVLALANEMHIEIVRLADMPEHKGKLTSQLYEIAKKNYETR